MGAHTVVKQSATGTGILGRHTQDLDLHDLFRRVRAAGGRAARRGRLRAHSVRAVRAGPDPRGGACPLSVFALGSPVVHLMDDGWMTRCGLRASRPVTASECRMVKSCKRCGS